MIHMSNTCGRNTFCGYLNHSSIKDQNLIKEMLRKRFKRLTWPVTEWHPNRCLLSIVISVVTLFNVEGAGRMWHLINPFEGAISTKLTRTVIKSIWLVGYRVWLTHLLSRLNTEKLLKWTSTDKRCSVIKSVRLQQRPKSGNNRNTFGRIIHSSAIHQHTGDPATSGHSNEQLSLITQHNRHRDFLA